MAAAAGAERAGGREGCPAEEGHFSLFSSLLILWVGGAARCVCVCVSERCLR